MSDSDASPDVCPNCGTPRQGSYCHACGQPRLDPKDRHLGHYLVHALRETLSLDGRLARSIRTLLLRPGELTRAYADGQRQRYLSPLRLFLLINVVYFIVQPFTGYTGYNTDLYSQVNRQYYRFYVDLSTPVIDAMQTRFDDVLAAEGLTRDSLTTARYETRFRTVNRQYTEDYNARSSTYARSLILVLIPLSALVFFLFYATKPFLATDHLIFATHYMTWQMLFIYCLFLPFLSLMGLLMLGVLHLLGLDFGTLADQHPMLSDVLYWISEYSSILLTTTYLTLAFRRFYRDRWWSALLRALLFVPIGMSLILLYRFGLFWLTFWTV